MDISVVEDPLEFCNPCDFKIDLNRVVLDPSKFRGKEEDDVYYFTIETEDGDKERSLSKHTLNSLFCDCGSHADFIVNNNKIQCESCCGLTDGVILNSLYERAKDFRVQAFGSSLFHQMAENYMDPKEVDKSHANLKLQTKKLNDALEELSLTSLRSTEDIIKWVYLFDEFNSCFFEDGGFKSISHSVGKHLARRLCDPIEKYYEDHHGVINVDMLESICTVDQYYK